MEKTMQKIEQQLSEIRIVKENLTISEAELKDQLKALKASMVEAEKCRPV